MAKWLKWIYYCTYNRVQGNRQNGIGIRNLPDIFHQLKPGLLELEAGASKRTSRCTGIVQFISSQGLVVNSYVADALLQEYNLFL